MISSLCPTFAKLESYENWSKDDPHPGPSRLLQSEEKAHYKPGKVRLFSFDLEVVPVDVDAHTNENHHTPLSNTTGMIEDSTHEDHSSGEHSSIENLNEQNFLNRNFCASDSQYVSELEAIFPHIQSSGLLNFDASSGFTENSTSKLTINPSPPGLPKLRGWEAKKEKLKAMGIDVDKCKSCGKFSRSAAKGRHRGYCRCLKREKVETCSFRLRTKDDPEDGYRWRKCGQRITKPGRNPRSYFRCSMNKACPAKRNTERDVMDPGILIVTYSGEHNHSSDSDKASSKSRKNSK